MCLQTNPNPGTWTEVCAVTARHAVAVLRLAGKTPHAENMIVMIASAPHDEREVFDLEFRHHSFCRECLDLACDWVAYHGSPADQAAYDAAERFFLITLPMLSADVRRLLDGSFAGILGGVRHEHA